MVDCFDLEVKMRVGKGAICFFYFFLSYQTS